MVSNISQGVCEYKGRSSVTGVRGTFVRMGSLRESLEIHALHEDSMSWRDRGMALLGER